LFTSGLLGGPAHQEAAVSGLREKKSAHNSIVGNRCFSCRRGGEEKNPSDDCYDIAKQRESLTLSSCWSEKKQYVGSIFGILSLKNQLPVRRKSLYLKSADSRSKAEAATSLTSEEESASEKSSEHRGRGEGCSSEGRGIYPLQKKMDVSEPKKSPCKSRS